MMTVVRRIRPPGSVPDKLFVIEQKPRWQSKNEGTESAKPKNCAIQMTFYILVLLSTRGRNPLSRIDLSK